MNWYLLDEIQCSIREEVPCHCCYWSNWDELQTRSDSGLGPLDVLEILAEVPLWRFEPGWVNVLRGTRERIGEELKENWCWIMLRGMKSYSPLVDRSLLSALARWTHKGSALLGCEHTCKWNSLWKLEFWMLLWKSTCNKDENGNCAYIKFSDTRCFTCLE